MTSRLALVTIPHEQAPKVLEFLTDTAGLSNLTVVHCDNCVMIWVRITPSQTQHILSGLQQKGVGVYYGFVDIVSLQANLPVRRVGNGETFTRSLRERPHAVEEIYSKVAMNAQCTSDFVILTVLSSLIAGVGLATNDNVHIVASMLLAPLMGPILGSALGVTVQDRRLFIVGLRSISVGLLTCFVTGVVTGLCLCPMGESLLWPTDEMKRKGKLANVLFGIIFACGCGGGVAVAITRGELKTLVGVALAASLLPPAVNAGINIVYGIVGPLVGQRCDSEEHISIAVGSAVLVLVNVFLIYCMAILVFRVKGITRFPRQDTTRWKDLNSPSLMWHDETPSIGIGLSPLTGLYSSSNTKGISATPPLFRPMSMPTLPHFHNITMAGNDYSPEGVRGERSSLNLWKKVNDIRRNSADKWRMRLLQKDHASSSQPDLLTDPRPGPSGPSPSPDEHC